MVKNKRTAKTQVGHWIVLALALLVGTVLLGGCSSIGVQPWERALLSEPGMAIDPDPVQTAFNDHIFFSKEASSGGLGTAGGGCGCN